MLGSLTTTDRVRALLTRHRELARSTLLIGGYSAWIFLFRLVVLTFITYFVMSGGRKPRFEEVSEAFGASEIGIMGIGALLYLLILLSLNPITETRKGEVVSPERWEGRFLPGFARGAVLSSGIVLAFLISGTYRYLGFFVQFEGTSLALASVAFRIVSLVLLAYFEEYFFRGKLLRRTRTWLRGLSPPSALADARKRQVALFWRDLGAVAVVAIAYCWIKLLQFDLGVMHLITLFVASLVLGVRALEDGDFARGAGFWAALLIVFHPLLSLPLFGNEFSGVVLVKYQAPLADPETDTTRFLTGGAGGPLSSFALQLLLLSDLARQTWALRKKIF